jgi:phosphatidylserine/phosphatidylglycerophosphate/cardiolipin synthase-like enzyme
VKAWTRRLSRPALAALAEALRSGQLAPPYTPASLARFVPQSAAASVSEALAELAADGVAPRHIARMVAWVTDERLAAQRAADRVQLVLSPPELDEIDSRDTAVVVQDLFAAAAERVSIVSYALDRGPRSRALFGVLAARMAALPSLEVRVFANVHREPGDERPAAALVAEFSTRFRAELWPGPPWPAVYHDPRSPDPDRAKRACLHAKCLVVDGRWSLVTSANFTEAAHQRNIEAGVLLDDRAVATRLDRQLDLLTESGALVPVPGLRRGG